MLYGNILVLTAAVYMVFISSDAKDRIILSAKGMHERRRGCM